MNFDNFTNVTSSQERDLEMSRAFPSLMRKVYVWMAMALAITGVIAYGAGNSPALIQLLYMGRGPLLVAGLVEVGIVWYLSSRIQKLSLVAATVWFIVFAAINGLPWDGFLQPSRQQLLLKPSLLLQEPSVLWL